MRYTLTRIAAAAVAILATGAPTRAVAQIAARPPAQPSAQTAQANVARAQQSLNAAKAKLRSDSLHLVALTRQRDEMRRQLSAAAEQASRINTQVSLDSWNLSKAKAQRDSVCAKAPTGQQCKDLNAAVTRQEAAYRASQEQLRSADQVRASWSQQVQKADAELVKARDEVGRSAQAVQLAERQLLVAQQIASATPPATSPAAPPATGGAQQSGNASTGSTGTGTGSASTGSASTDNTSTGNTTTGGTTATPAAPRPAAASGVLFADDFSADQVSDFPAKLELREGNMAVVEHEGQKLLKSTTQFELAIPLAQVLPQRFTLEMDFFFPDAPPYRYGQVSVKFHEGAPDFAVCSPTDAGIMGRTGFDRKSMTDMRPQTLREQIVRCRIAVDGTRAKVFMDDRQVGNAPNADFGRSRKIIVAADARDDDPVLLGNIRIVGQP